MKKASDWKEFTAPDGRKYYYNSTTKVSSWTMPDELKKGSETPSAAKASPAAHGTPSIQVQPGIPGHHACDAEVVEPTSIICLLSHNNSVARLVVTLQVLAEGLNPMEEAC